MAGNQKAPKGLLEVGWMLLDGRGDGESPWLRASLIDNISTKIGKKNEK